jgi:hypothetical protein
MDPAEVYTGPPGPERVAPRLDTEATQESINWTTTNRYPGASQTSRRDILRLACAALSAEELSEWMCGHVLLSREQHIPEGGNMLSMTPSNASFS